LAVGAGLTFFTSKEASDITGCTPAVLQYWQEKRKRVLLMILSGKLI